MPRPQSLTPLFRSLQSFKGVGPQLSALLNRYFSGPDAQAAIALDVLMHMPTGVIDRRRQVGIAEAYFGATVTLLLHVDRHQPPPKGKPQVPHRVFAHDETGEIQLVFFRAQGGWVEKALPVGEKRYVSGEIGFFNGEKQITHPDYIVAENEFGSMPLVEPVYPLTQGLSSKALRKLVHQVLDALPELDDWVPQGRKSGRGWPTFSDAMRQVHAPQKPQEADLAGPARSRLAYDEYLAGQLALQIVRARLGEARGIARQFDGHLMDKVAAALPFALTDGQKQAVADISGDLRGPNRMSRLLQGDVGAGKTVVALMAMAALAESGGQSAMMAPTELLAAQHFKTLAPLCEAVGLNCVLLTGKMPAAERTGHTGRHCVG